uniref:Uncharacterized protein n=1 Tax=Rhodnius prolixus TaxID=13249 RepID=T1HAJ7_RHOPR
MAFEIGQYRNQPIAYITRFPFYCRRNNVTNLVAHLFVFSSNAPSSVVKYKINFSGGVMYLPRAGHASKTELALPPQHLSKSCGSTLCSRSSIFTWYTHGTSVFLALPAVVTSSTYNRTERPSDGGLGLEGVPALDDGRAGEPSRRILLDIGSQPPSFVAPSTNTLGPGSSVMPTNRTSPPTTEHSTTVSSQGNIDCVDRRPLHYIAQRGDYWVLYNYIVATTQFRCWESVTYTTHADYTFMENLEPLLDRWKGPISLALHAPGTDFETTLRTIHYLRDCSPQPISQLVTFHIYFPSKHLPKMVPKSDKLFLDRYNCSIPAPWFNATTYKTQKKLMYPINVGRNIARESATTHYLLASDIELYPSPGVINDFLDMIRRNGPSLRHGKPKVFPLSIFELEANMSLPNDKTELVTMLKNGSAIPFHKKVCPRCHNVPHSKEWLKANSSQGGLAVFHIGKRKLDIFGDDRQQSDLLPLVTRMKLKVKGYETELPLKLNISAT